MTAVNTKRAITIAFDLDCLQSYTDQFLAQLWHVAQANQAPILDDEAGDMAEKIGREIVWRWLASVPPDLWQHQGRHAVWCGLQAVRNATGAGA